MIKRMNLKSILLVVLAMFSIHVMAMGNDENSINRQWEVTDLAKFFCDNPEAAEGCGAVVLDLSEPNVYRIYYLSKTDEKWYTMAEGTSSVTPGDGATGVVMLDESYNYALENGVLLLSNAKTSFSLKATAGIVTQGKPKME